MSRFPQSRRSLPHQDLEGGAEQETVANPYPNRHKQDDDAQPDRDQPSVAQLQVELVPDQF